MVAKTSFMYFDKQTKRFYAELITPSGRKRKSLKTSDKKEAERAFQKLVAFSSVDSDEKLLYEMARLNRLRISEKSTGFDEVWKVFENSPARSQCSAITLKGYRSIFNQWRDWAKEHQVNIQAKSTDALQYFAHFWNYGKGVSPRTYNAHRQGLVYIYKILFIEEKVLENPFLKIIAKPGQTQSRNEFSVEQVQAIFNVFNPDTENDLKLLFMIGCWTGKRLGDAAMTRVEEFDFNLKTISYIPHKTEKRGKVITLPLKSDLMQALQLYNIPKTGYLFPRFAEMYQRDKPSLSRICQSILERAQIVTTRKIEGRQKAVVDYGFHSFRHSFVSFCAVAGVPEAIVREAVGHGSPAMTRHYTHIRVDAMRKAIDALPDINI